MVGAELSEYERKRLENIKRNQMVLESLAIPILPMKAEVVSEQKIAPGSRRKRPEKKIPDEITTGPKRISARLINKANGTATKLSVADELALYRQMPVERPIQPRPKRIIGNIPFEPERGATTDFQKLMNYAVTTSMNKHESEISKRSSKHYINGEFSIAKAVDERVYSMAIHPSREKIIISAGSKSGGFGIWDATDAWNGDATERQTFYFKPHAGSISNQRYNPVDSGKLLLTSYDGMVRCLDIIKGEFCEIYRAEEDQYISGFDISIDGNNIYFTDMDGVLTIKDIRGKGKETFQLHGKKAGGLSVSPVDNNYLATSSLDDTICIWDRRVLKEFESDIISRFEYRRAVTSVFFHPKILDALVSTCYDDSVRIHRGFLGTDPAETRIAHNNQTGRWITPFRAIWDPKSTDELHSNIIVGNMNRGLDVVSMKTGQITNNISDLLTAQPAVNAVHHTLDLIASGTASGKCILWKAM